MFLYVVCDVTTLTCQFWKPANVASTTLSVYSYEGQIVLQVYGNISLIKD